MSAPSNTDPARFTTRSLAVCLAALLGLGILAAYFNSFDVRFFFDDVPTILRNLSIRDISDVRQVFSPPQASATVSRPIANLAFAIDHALWGYDVWWYHLTNFVIHLGTSLLLLGVVRRSMERLAIGGCGCEVSPLAAAERSRRSLLWAAAIAAVWALHPLHTESVTFLTSRAESLAGFFYLLTLYAFIRHAESGARRWACVSAAACALGMLSKEVVVSAPLFVLLYDRGLHAGTFAQAWRRRWPLYTGYSLAWCGLAWVVIASGGSRGGTCGFGVAVSSWHYLLTQCWAIVTYLRLALWPDALCFDYGRMVVRDVWAIFPQAAFLIGLASATLIGIWRRSWWGLVGAWFFMILAPSSSFVPLATQTVAEHRMYLPLVAVVVVAAAAVHRVVGANGWIVLAVVAPPLGWLTHGRNELYLDPLALWADVVAKQPENSRARDLFGCALVQENRYEEALAQHEVALALTEGNDGAIHANRAIVLMLLERADEAERSAWRACELEPANAEFRNTLGNIFWMRGRFGEAEREFQRVLDLDPLNAGATFGLGNVAYSQGRTEAAVAFFARSFAAFPLAGKVANNLGSALLDLGQDAKALGYFREAARLDPKLGRAHANYATLLAKTGRVAEAIPSFEKAVQLMPKDVETLTNLGLAYELTGATDEARRQYEKVLLLQPGNGALRQRLAALSRSEPPPPKSNSTPSPE